MLGAILSLLALPYLNTSEVRSSHFRPLYTRFYWIFIVDCRILGWIGQMVVEYPYVEVGQVGSLYYFRFLFGVIPVVGRLEGRMIRN